MHESPGDIVEHGLRKFALGLIRFYQRFVSPHKGFRCAYCVFTGNASCSALGYRAIRRFGVMRGARILRGRMHKCGVAYRRYHIAQLTVVNRQSGFLDCGGCDGPGSCDMPGTSELPCKITEAACDCPCDCDLRSRRNQENDDVITYIPPETRRR